jgi:hypothetical protein
MSTRPNYQKDSIWTSNEKALNDLPVSDLLIHCDSEKQRQKYFETFLLDHV